MAHNNSLFEGLRVFLHEDMNSPKVAQSSRHTFWEVTGGRKGFMDIVNSGII